ncbi:hypothetical protein GCM10009737_30340 [Nocardioides lentus]|uniref:Phage shock protein PspC N-terminal domain-containing protein n=1 Tax=Nocardioides lentus TaxID=338077 RepID=A0ABN2PN37_9ACTN
MAALVRRSDTAWVAGVCSGIAARTGISVNIIRLATVLGVVFGLGTVAVLYVVLWVVLPKE